MKTAKYFDEYNEYVTGQRENINKIENERQELSQRIKEDKAKYKELIANSQDDEADALYTTFDSNEKKLKALEKRLSTKKEVFDEARRKKAIELIKHQKEVPQLYKKDKDTYKYLFNKYFDTNYDDVKLPTRKELEKMTADKLTPEQSTKLELEDKKGYSMYLDNTVDLSKYDKSSDSNSDSDTLKEDIAKELNDRATIEEVNYYNDSLGKNAVIVIKGKENLSDKITSNGMRSAVANVVKGVKNSDIDLDDFTVDVDYPVTTKGDSTSDEHIIKSKWSMNTVNSLSEKQLELLNENLNEYADSYYESSALK